MQRDGEPHLNASVSEKVTSEHIQRAASDCISLMLETAKLNAAFIKLGDG